MSNENGKLGILVGGGPAPGINGVISAATIEARENKLGVVGIYDGFENLIKGRDIPYKNLEIEDVSQIHFQGGSILRTSRANPTKSQEAMDNVLASLRQFGIRYLITIGGDDTAFSASRVAQAAKDEIRVAHVPKTIDNDLPLPASIPTFGYETARHVGAEIVRNLAADAKTMPRWYIVIAMGRQAGHLALGIGKAAAAPFILIPEEYEKGKVTFDQICDTLEAAIIKRRAMDRHGGVAILAEGLLERMTSEHLIATFGENVVRFDAHNHPILDDIPFGIKVRDNLRERFKKRNLNIKLTNKNLGYELRCADPIPFDREYTRDLGYGAVRFLLEGNTAHIISFEGGKLNPRRFDLMLNDQGRFNVRMVNITGESYRVARNYMIRLEPEDGRDPDKIAKYAAAGNLTVAQFHEKFGFLLRETSHA